MSGAQRRVGYPRRHPNLAGGRQDAIAGSHNRSRRIGNRQRHLLAPARHKPQNSIGTSRILEPPDSHIDDAQRRSIRRQRQLSGRTGSLALLTMRDAVANFGQILDAALLALEIEIFRRDDLVLTENDEFLIRALSCWSIEKRKATLSALMTGYGRPDLASHIVHALARLVCRDVEARLRNLVREHSHFR
jgi:hypothetical protein